VSEYLNHSIPNEEKVFALSIAYERGKVKRISQISHTERMYIFYIMGKT